MKRFIITLILILAALLQMSSIASAGDRLVIGIIPEINLVKQMERYTPLLKYLGRQINMEVGVKPLANYGLIYEEMRDGKIDAGFFGSFIYVMAHSRIGVEPIARPVTPSGISTYAGYTFVRKDSGIKSPKDMKGKTIALVDPATTAGYIAQKAYLKRNGIDIDKDMKIVWAGSHDAAAKAVFNKQADIGGAKNNQINKIIKEDSAFKSAIAILDESPNPAVPENTLAVRKDLDSDVKAKIKKALLSMDKDAEGKKVLEKFGASRFIDTKDGDYKSLYDIVKYLNIDLNKYSYKKR